MYELMWFAVGTLNTVSLVILLPKVYRLRKPWQRTPTETSTPPSLYSRPLSQWTQEERENERLLIQEILKGMPPFTWGTETTVSSYPPRMDEASLLAEWEAEQREMRWAPDPSPETSFTSSLPPQGGPNGSGMKPQASPGASPRTGQTPSEIVAEVLGFSNSTSPHGFDTRGRVQTIGLTPSSTPEQRGPSTTMTLPEASDPGSSGPVAQDRLCDCGHIGGQHWTHGQPGPRPCHSCACLRFRRMKVTRD